MKLIERVACVLVCAGGTFTQGISPPAKVAVEIGAGQQQTWYLEAVKGAECRLKFATPDPAVVARLQVVDLQTQAVLGEAIWDQALPASVADTGKIALPSSGRFGVRLTGLAGSGSFTVFHKLSFAAAAKKTEIGPEADGASIAEFPFHVLAGWRLDMRLKADSGPGIVQGVTLLYPSGREEDLLPACKVAVTASRTVVKLKKHELPETGEYRIRVHGDPAAEAPPTVTLTIARRANKLPKSETSAGSYSNVLYVDDDAGGAQTGDSWPDAFPDLQLALDRAWVLLADPAIETAPAGTTAIEIRIAGGTYRPDGGTLDRALLFDVPRGVALRGGYAGLEGSGGDERDIETYATVLSGDLLGNDDAGLASRMDNSAAILKSDQHVGVVSIVTYTTVELDGLSIRGAYKTANDVIGPSAAVSIRQPRIVVKHCNIHDHVRDQVEVVRPIVSLENARIVLTDTRIHDNHATMALTGPYFSPVPAILGVAVFLDPSVSGGIESQVTDCDISGNVLTMDTTSESSGGGGADDVSIAGCGIYVDGSPAPFAPSLVRIERCSICDNRLEMVATGMYPLSAIEVRGVGICTSPGTSMIGCTIEGNRLIDMVGAASPPSFDFRSCTGVGLFGPSRMLQGCTITGNEFQSPSGTTDWTVWGGGIGGKPESVVDCLIAGNTATEFGGLASDSSATRVVGCTLVGNVTTAAAGANFMSGGQVLDSIIAGYESGAGTSIDNGLVTGVGALQFDHSLIGVDAASLFKDPFGPDGLAGTGDEDLHASGLIDAGSPEAYASLLGPLGVPSVAGHPLRDAAGQPRFRGMAVVNSLPAPDVGALETQP